MTLDNPEMTITLMEMGQDASIAESGRAPAASTISPDWLNELNSAASLVLDREEREALARELDLITRSHPIAA
jgi:hypothetical protein